MHLRSCLRSKPAVLYGYSYQHLFTTVLNPDSDTDVKSVDVLLLAGVDLKSSLSLTRKIADSVFRKTSGTRLTISLRFVGVSPQSVAH